MIIVPDASVLLKWVMGMENESDHHQAMRLRDALLAGELEIRVPTLWRYEIGNVLGFKQPRLAAEMIGALLAHEFEEVPLRTEYALEVLEHMRGVAGVTFYDSAYHVLALRTEGLYLTADKAYVKRAKSKGRVVLLADWEGP
jgi:predicted nucleic acid-binding protein